jgi:hypothetical protein
MYVIQERHKGCHYSFFCSVVELAASDLVFSPLPLIAFCLCFFALFFRVLYETQQKKVRSRVTAADEIPESRSGSVRNNSRQGPGFEYPTFDFGL